MSGSARARLAPRLRYLATKHPRDLAAIAARESLARRDARRSERALARAARSQAPVLAGPFLGEVGYELLYWIPVLRRLLRRHGIPRERVTIFTRGGAAAWYRDLAAGAVDVFDLAEPDEYLEALAARRRAARDEKQVRVAEQDAELVRRALARIGPAEVVHPAAMYVRLRWIWRGWQEPQAALRLGDYQLLDVERRWPAGLPRDYVVVKAYFGDCFPDTPSNRAFLRDLVQQLADEVEVVQLSTGVRVDPHHEWEPIAGGRVHRVDALEPRSNLAVQTQAVLGARALVAPYGGFSYLGPFLGVPTIAFQAVAAGNPAHRTVLENALHPVFDVVPTDSVANALSAIIAVARSSGSARATSQAHEAV